MWAVFEGIVTGGVEGVVSEGIVRHGKMPEPKHEPPHNKPPVERKRIEDIQKEFGSGIGSNLIPPLTQPDKKKAPSFNSEDKIIEGFRLRRFTRPDLPRSVSPPVQIKEQTDPIEAFRRGYAYDTGMGATRRDPIKAEEWYKKAAKRGHVGAQYYLNFAQGFSASCFQSLRPPCIMWV